MVRTEWSGVLRVPIRSDASGGSAEGEENVEDASDAGSRPGRERWVLIAPRVETAISRICPECGRPAATHGYRDRVVNDWEVTHFRCTRLRCCGRTFLATPHGVRPRSRFSDRVVLLARTLVGLGVSAGNCVEVFRSLGVPMTRQAIGQWAKGIESRPRATARSSVEADGSVSIRIGEDSWIAIDLGDDADEATRTDASRAGMLQGVLAS